MIRFGIKVGVAAGSAYYLNEQGLWKESEEATKLYGKLNALLTPYIGQAKTQIPFEIPQLPKLESIPNNAANYWNKGVKVSISFLTDLPNNTKSLIGKGVNMLQENKEVKNLLGGNQEVRTGEKK